MHTSLLDLLKPKIRISSIGVRWNHSRAAELCGSDLRDRKGAFFWP
jgi:hypothetical protein